MGKIELLRSKLGILQTEIDAIEKKVETEKRSHTEDEYKLINEKLDAMDQLEDELRTLERLEERKEKTEKPEKEKEERGETSLVVGNTNEKFSCLGERLQAVARAALPRGMYIGGLECGVRDRRLDNIGYETRATGMSEAVPADGGFLVDKDTASELIKKVHETGILMSKTRQIGIGPNSNGLKVKTIDETSRETGSRWGGIRVYRLNEGGTKTASQPKFGMFELSLEKMIALTYATDELIQDAVALGNVVSQGFAEEFGFKIDDEIINGTGAGEMLGILNSPALVSVAKEIGQVAATVVYENIIKMWARLWSRSKPNSVWLINTAVMPQLQQMSLAVGTGGIPVYTPANGAAGSPYGTLMGRPVIEIEQAAALGTVGDIMLVDLSQYLTIEKGGLQSASSIHVQFTTDETAFRWVMRNNGQPTWTSALTPYKGSDTLSPFVALATRS